MKQLVSIIIPVFNEEKNIWLIYKKLLSVWQTKLSAYNYEIVLIDDSSTDTSLCSTSNL